MPSTDVILTENVPGLGAEADVVKVRRGYARNFLLPRGKAYEVTPASLRQLDNLKKNHNKWRLNHRPLGLVRSLAKRVMALAEVRRRERQIKFSPVHPQVLLRIFTAHRPTALRRSRACSVRC